MAYVILFLFTYGSAQNIFAKCQTLLMKALEVLIVSPARDV